MVQVLAGKGMRVTLLEAGPMLNPAKDYKEHMWPYEVAHRGVYDADGIYLGRQDSGSRLWGYFDAPNGYWSIEGEPYTTAPGTGFQWFRSRILGGRTNHYGRISLRFSDYDFRPYSTDGLGTDWPVTYDDLAPYYDKLESLIGVTGTREGLRTAPDGIFLPPPNPRVSDILVTKACRKLGIPCIPGRRAVLTKPMKGRPACHYCGRCGRGCVTAEFIDVMVTQSRSMAALYTGGLGWIDAQMVKRCGKRFVDAAPAEQTALLDQFAWRRNTSPELAPGIEFFEWLRKMTVDAYYTSKAGIAELGFKGNGARSTFDVPAEAIEYALKRSPFTG